MNLYSEAKVSRALMDTASASSIVTDSAAASSAFGGGTRVKNGMLNMGPNGEKYLPIWQKFKQEGKKSRLCYYCYHYTRYSSRFLYQFCK